VSERRHDDPALERLLRLAGPRACVPEEVTRRVRAQVHTAWRGQRQRRTGRRLAWTVAAAAAVVLVLVTLGVLRRSTPVAMVARVDAVAGPVGLQAGDELPAGSRLTTPPGSRLALRAVDGGSVRLDEGSTVTLRSANVFVLERGAVYVDAGPSEKATPSIDTPFGEVRHVGTQYEVRLLDRSLRVQVREGRVRVDRAGSPLAVDAGSALTVDAAGATHRERLDPYGPRWEWVLQVAAAPEIDGRPLRELLEWVSRECGQEIVFEDPALAARSAGIVLSGSIRGLSPLAALEAVLPTCGLTHRMEQRSIRIEAEPEAAG
jgi:ferric-dicitrate binding protein FerR (iron transport regulator)